MFIGIIMLFVMLVSSKRRNEYFHDGKCGDNCNSLNSEMRMKAIKLASVDFTITFVVGITLAILVLYIFAPYGGVEGFSLVNGVKISIAYWWSSILYLSVFLVVLTLYIGWRKKWDNDMKMALGKVWDCSLSKMKKSDVGPIATVAFLQIFFIIPIFFINHATDTSITPAWWDQIWVNINLYTFIVLALFSVILFVWTLINYRKSKIDESSQCSLEINEDVFQDSTILKFIVNKHLIVDEDDFSHLELVNKNDPTASNSK